MAQLIDERKIAEYGCIYDDLFFALKYAFASIPENDELDYIKNTTFNEKLIFYALYGHPGVTLKELAGLSGIEYRNLSAYVNTLVAKGYVDKKSVTSRNGIKSSISLSELGMKTIRENNEAMREGVRRRGVRRDDGTVQKTHGDTFKGHSARYRCLGKKQKKT